MDDYSEHLVEIQRAMADLADLLAKKEFAKAKEKALLIQYCAMAVKSCCDRHGMRVGAQTPPPVALRGMAGGFLDAYTEGERAKASVMQANFPPYK